MNLDSKLDRIGPDHKIRNDLRNFLLVYHHNSEVLAENGSALYALYDNCSAGAEQVAKELYALFYADYSIDYVYQFSTDDIRRFAEYAKNEEKIEKVRTLLAKACKIAYDAGVKHEELQGWIVDNYEDISIDKEFHYRFAVKDKFEGF